MSEYRDVAPTELDEACRSLSEDGFCHIPGIIGTDLAAQFADRVTQQAKAERRLELDFEYPADDAEDEVNQWVYQLVNKGDSFWQLPLHPVAQHLATHVLGKDFLLSALDSHITRPNNKPMPLHADQWWMPPPMTPGQDYVRQGNLDRTNGNFGEPTMSTEPITPTFILNIMWMMTDFTVENGATRVVPGSHLSGRVPTGEPRNDELQVEGPAGSILAWDGRTWHGSGLNTSDGPRVGVTTYFSGPMFRGLGNQTFGIHTDVRERLPEEMAVLLGFRPWNTYGMTDDPSANLAKAGDDTVGKLS